MAGIKHVLVSPHKQLASNPMASSSYNPLPKYKKGERVAIRNGEKDWTDSARQYKPRKGILRSEGYRDKPACADKGGKRHFVYDVQWDGRSGTRPVRQNRIVLEETK